jgi:CheY-like chemotaxis protein
LIGNLQELLRRTLREDVEIRGQHSPTPLTAFADAAQLESALINLALNAQDAMPKGGHLTISSAIAELDDTALAPNADVKLGRYVMIAVTDDGTGMTAEVREHVFEPFFTTKEVGKGSGLGLSMVYGFIKQSGGHVALYSEPGLGTTIRMYLPIDESGHPASDHAADCAEAEVPCGHETVLVTEDDPFVRGYAVSCLESLGYKVLTAADGGEALAKLSDGATPDVLFTDVIMPGGVSGWDLVRKARRLHPGLKMLMTSGYALDTLVSDRRLPPDAVFINKPYRRNDLARSVREAIESADA